MLHSSMSCRYRHYGRTRHCESRVTDAMVPTDSALPLRGHSRCRHGWVVPRGRRWPSRARSRNRGRCLACLYERPCNGIITPRAHLAGRQPVRSQAASSCALIAAASPALTSGSGSQRLPRRPLLTDTPLARTFMQ
jgi:hypothetical protein